MSGNDMAKRRHRPQWISGNHTTVDDPISSQLCPNNWVRNVMLRPANLYRASVARPTTKADRD